MNCKIGYRLLALPVKHPRLSTNQETACSSAAYKLSTARGAKFHALPVASYAQRSSPFRRTSPSQQSIQCLWRLQTSAYPTWPGILSTISSTAHDHSFCPPARNQFFL